MKPAKIGKNITKLQTNSPHEIKQNRLIFVVIQNFWETKNKCCELVLLFPSDCTWLKFHKRKRKIVMPSSLRSVTYNKQIFNILFHWLLYWLQSIPLQGFCVLTKGEKFTQNVFQASGTKTLNSSKSLPMNRTLVYEEQEVLVQPHPVPCSRDKRKQR